MRKYIVTFAITLALMAAVRMYDGYEAKELNDKIESLSFNLAHAEIPVIRDTIHDSIEVVTQTVIEVAPKQMSDALADRQRLINDLNLRIRQLEAVQTTVTSTADTVTASHSSHDSLYYYHDQWADISLSVKDTVFCYNIRDSLSTVVYREYKHRFLWWRWGTKGYKVAIVNFNPHARVTYNQFVKRAE